MREGLVVPERTIPTPTTVSAPEDREPQMEIAAFIGRKLGAGN